MLNYGDGNSNNIQLGNGQGGPQAGGTGNTQGGTQGGTGNTQGGTQGGTGNTQGGTQSGTGNTQGGTQGSGTGDTQGGTQGGTQGAGVTAAEPAIPAPSLSPSALTFTIPTVMALPAMQ